MNSVIANALFLTYYKKKPRKTNEIVLKMMHGVVNLYVGTLILAAVELLVLRESVIQLRVTTTDRKISTFSSLGG